LPTSARSDMGVDIHIQIAPSHSPVVEKRLVRHVLEHSGEGWLIKIQGDDKSAFGPLRELRKRISRFFFSGSRGQLCVISAGFYLCTQAR
jgi:hypothetical protein